MYGEGGGGGRVVVEGYSFLEVRGILGLICCLRLKDEVDAA